MDCFNEKYEIRFARYDEIGEVMRFIDTYWRKGHILGNDREFFEYEMVIEGRVNFLIAKERVSGEIHGILGFLPASCSTDKFDIWYVVWKVIEGAMPLLGIQMKKKLRDETYIRYDLNIGMNPDTSVKLESVIFKRKVAKMAHYYCLAERSAYHVARVGHYEKYMENRNYIVPIREFKRMEELQTFFSKPYTESIIPYKDKWYINRRYFQHPIYKYHVYGLEDRTDVGAIMVCREQEHEGELVLRIVDYIGKPELFRGISGFLKQGLQKYEYIDFYCYGFDEEYVRQTGMIKLEENDTNIIPNYFSPYEARNVDIWIGASAENAVFFKADGDQDRPS